MKGFCVFNFSCKLHKWITIWLCKSSLTRTRFVSFNFLISIFYLILHILLYLPNSLNNESLMIWCDLCMDYWLDDNGHLITEHPDLVSEVSGGFSAFIYIRKFIGIFPHINANVYRFYHSHFCNKTLNEIFWYVIHN